MKEHEALEQPGRKDTHAMKKHEELRNRDALDVANRATSFATVPITNSQYPRKEDMMHAIAHPIEERTT